MSSLDINPARRGKNRFSRKDDETLRKLIREMGTKDWGKIATRMPGNRNPRQCRERWINYVNPLIKKKPWDQEEDNLLIEKYEEIGSKWKILKACFPHRSTNQIKNRLTTLLRHKEKMENLNYISEEESDVQENAETPYVVESPTKPTVEVNIAQIIDRCLSKTGSEWMDENWILWQGFDYFGSSL